MILWGEIRLFPLFTVLQFLAGQRVTGILEIQDFEEVGAVYIKRGRIELVSSGAWDEVLGARLVAAGALTESQVKECWMESGTADEEHPAVARLLERAEGDHRVLREVVDAHTGDAVMELMSWNAGTFRLTTPAKPVELAIVPLRNTDELLLDAFRRVDEGERPWHEKNLAEEELCLTCTVECSEEIKARYLKPDLCLWRSMPSILKDTIYKAAKERRGSAFDDDTFDELPLYLTPMRVSIICVGRLAREYLGVWRHYESLVRPYVNLEVFEAPETPLRLGDEQARAKEGTALLGLLRKGAFTVALDSRGEQYSSEAWSGLLAGKKVDGCSHFQFVLGGASGLDQRVLGAADLRWSLSPLTFPHQMARCIVLEQLYRSLRIERGEPYHH